ncbi:MAG: mandelate racemase/muconate lactonizing enzyme family protein [Saprospiraceae bacterium]|nr:mandelate racemase/muconate lactonizing enzyme family protein [Saprospiraceae bacterium]
MDYFNTNSSRRAMIKNLGNTLFMGTTIIPLQRILAQTSRADRNISITGIEVFIVNVTHRTNWIIVQLTASNGVTGLGEGSLGRRAELEELKEFYALVKGKSPFDIQHYRQQGWLRAASGDRLLAASFSAIEMALWDINGKTLEVPFHQLIGGKIYESLPVYANINRATSIRTPQGFATNARQAVAEGFKAIKAAPFDGFPALNSPIAEINRARKSGVDAVFAMREAVGNEIAIKIDAHSYFDVALSIEIAKELESANLSWYEEPVAPTQLEDTVAIHQKIKQTMAGGEFLFGMQGFRPIIESRVVDIIMPDIKYCGGLLEAIKIATLAENFEIKVAPHNPSGPVSTAASVALCSVLPNFDILEYQWGEAEWRTNLIEPKESIVNGFIQVNHRPGFGISLNQDVLEAHRLK